MARIGEAMDAGFAVAPLVAHTFLPAAPDPKEVASACALFVSPLGVAPVTDVREPRLPELAEPIGMGNLLETIC